MRINGVSILTPFRVSKLYFFSWGIHDTVFPDILLCGSSWHKRPSLHYIFSVWSDHCVWNRAQDKWTVNLYGTSFVGEEWTVLHSSSWAMFLHARTTSKFPFVCGIKRSVYCIKLHNCPNAEIKKCLLLMVVTSYGTCFSVFIRLR
jgi:hypothetical protein